MQTRTLDIKELPSIAALLAMIETGQEIVIEDEGKPLARLSPIAESIQQRIPGLHEGQGWIAEDFDAPLPNEFRSGCV